MVLHVTRTGRAGTPVTLPKRIFTVRGAGFWVLDNLTSSLPELFRAWVCACYFAWQRHPPGAKVAVMRVLVSDVLRAAFPRLNPPPCASRCPSRQYRSKSLLVPVHTDAWYQWQRLHGEFHMLLALQILSVFLLSPCSLFSLSSLLSSRWDVFPCSRRAREISRRLILLASHPAPPSPANHGTLPRPAVMSGAFTASTGLCVGARSGSQIFRSFLCFFSSVTSFIPCALLVVAHLQLCTVLCPPALAVVPIAVA